MQGIKLVTDSTAYLSPDIIAKYDISVVSLIVNFLGESFLEGKLSSYRDFYDQLKNSHQYPTTSQPSAGEFHKAYDELTKDGSSVISLHISGKLSGTLQSALTAAAMLKDRDITVIDSLSTYSSLAFMVETAGEMIKMDKSKTEIISEMEFMKHNSSLYFLVDSLEYLRRGGRIGGAAALIGTILQIKPILHIKEGAVDVFAKVRTKVKAVNTLLQEVEDQLADKDPKQIRLAVVHVDNPAGAEEMKALVSKRWPEISLRIHEAGPVIGSHVGLGCYGIVIAETRVGQ